MKIKILIPIYNDWQSADKLINKIKFLFPIVSELTIALVIAIIFAINFDSLKVLNATILFGVILHNIGGLFIGYFVARFFTLSNASIKTISIEVGMQNSGLGVVLAKENYVNPSTAIPSAISSLVHSIYGSIFVSIFKEHKKQD